MTLPPLEFTGERLVPGQVDRQLLAEHVARYQYAVAEFRALPEGAPVLDLASGAGYGTRMLAEIGLDALGVDIAPEAVAWATAVFSELPLPHPPRYQVADVTATGLPAASFLGIIAFEILEHLTDPARLLAEIRRLLAPGGYALVSTPNREAHQIAGENEFHHQEYSPAEFEALLQAHFPGWRWTIAGQLTEGIAGNPLLGSLRKTYISLKRTVGLGPLVAKPPAPWSPADSLLSLPHPYGFTPGQTAGAEYLVARLEAPGPP